MAHSSGCRRRETTNKNRMSIDAGMGPDSTLTGERRPISPLELGGSVPWRRGIPHVNVRRPTFRSLKRWPAFPTGKRRPSDLGLRLFRIGSREQVVFADLVEELAAADAEPLGGPGAVALAGEQGALDGPTLDVGQQGAERESGRRRHWPPAIAGSMGSSTSRCSGRMVRPRATITARARVFSSCRTLPGQVRSWISPEGLGRERERAPAVPPLDSPEDVLGQGARCPRAGRGAAG